MDNAQEPRSEGIPNLGLAISRLRLDHRKAFLMNRVEKLSYEEIAVRLGLSTAQVERTVAAALYALERDLSRVNRPWWRLS